MSRTSRVSSTVRPPRSAASRVLPWLLLLAVVPLTSCGTTGVSASTTCGDFLELDEQTQQTAVETLAARTHGDAFKGPMGILNLVYDCQYTPHSTIGHVMGLSS